MSEEKDLQEEEIGSSEIKKESEGEIKNETQETPLEDDYKEKYLRALADYQNLLKQSAKDKTDFVKFALENFLQEIIPVYDHLKLSLKGLSDEEAKSAWVEGVKHVLKQFKSVLESHGVTEIKTEGEKFNHDEMEALDGEGDKVKSEVMPGYKLNGKVMRAAKVIVEK